MSENQWPTKKYKCSGCGTIKDVLINHDQLPEIWERCTDQCMWVATEGPVLLSVEGEKTGFRKRKFHRVG